MTKDEIVERWTDELLGRLAHAAVASPTGSGFSLWLRVEMNKVRNGVKALVDAASANVVEEFVAIYPTLGQKEKDAIKERLKGK